MTTSLRPGGVLRVQDYLQWVRTFTQSDVRNNETKCPHLRVTLFVALPFLCVQVNAFAEVSGDKNPLHLDPDFAATTRFRKCVVHGMLTSAMFSTLFATNIPGAIYLSQSLQFTAPVHVLDAVTARVEVRDISKRRVTCVTTVRNDTTAQLAVKGEATVLVPASFVE